MTELKRLRDAKHQLQIDLANTQHQLGIAIAERVAAMEYIINEGWYKDFIMKTGKKENDIGSTD